MLKTDASAPVRERVLDAAVRALTTRGYSGATTLHIQELAGVSRGSLLHYFPLRDDLLVAAVSHLATARIRDAGAIGALADDLGERSDAAIGRMWSNYDQDYFWAAQELWLAARHNTALADALRPAEREVQREVHATTRALFGAGLAAHPRFDAILDVVNTSMRGAAAAYGFLPDRDPAAEPLLPTWRAVVRAELGLPA